MDGCVSPSGNETTKYLQKCEENDGKVIQGEVSI